ncbi:MAG: protein kinase domain-containing protein [Armatimonadota bacterium]
METGQFVGRYRIIREIARSNDVVYEALDPVIGRRVAVKVLILPPNLSGEARRERIERFHREAKAAGKLSHPNIVTIHEVGESQGQHFIAMEYLEGHTLRDILQLQGPLPVDRAKDIALQILDALDYAHSQNVVHRDIKPDNIHILPDGRVKITDFGIARIMTDPAITTDGRVFGTPSYMSPEQVAGRPVDERSDLFSLGVVLYEMVTGRKPFVGDSIVTITYQITAVDPPVPEGIPSDLAAVIMKALAKDVSARYQSAREMANDIRSRGSTALTAPASPATFVPQPPSTVEPTMAPQRSASARSGLGTFAMSVVLGTAIGFLLLLTAWVVRAAYVSYVQSVSQREAFEALRLAKANYDAGRYEEAARAYAEIAARWRDTIIGPTARKNAAVALFQMAVQAANTNPRRALEVLHQAEQFDPVNPSIQLLMGDLNYRIGNQVAAIRHWERTTQLDPSSVEAARARHNLAVLYYELGLARIRQGDVDGARQMWARAALADPGSDVSSMAELQLHRLGSTAP